MTVSTFFPAPSPDVSTDTSLRVPSAASCTSCAWMAVAISTPALAQQASKARHEQHVQRSATFYDLHTSE